MRNRNSGRVENINRRNLLKGGAAGALLASGPGINLFATAANAQSAKVVAQYDWLLGNGQIGDIVAAQKGYFKDQGIDVEMIPGGPNAATLAPVVSQSAQLGQFSGASQLLLASAAGAPVTMFATGYQDAPFAYFSLPDAPVREPKDLIGKKIGIQPTARPTLDALLAKTGIDPADLDISTMGFDMTPLAAGELQVVTGWITNTQALEVIGPDRITMMSASAGVLDPGNVYFATAQAIEENADLLARYLTACAKGWEFTYENPEEAVEIAVGAHPNLDLDVEKKTIPLVLQLSFTKNTAMNGWGTFKPSDIQDQIDLMGQIGMFDGYDKPLVDMATSTKILEMTADARPKFG